MGFDKKCVFQFNFERLLIPLHDFNYIKLLTKTGNEQKQIKK